MRVLRDVLLTLAALAGIATLHHLLTQAGRDAAYYTDIALRFTGVVAGIIATVALFLKLLILALEGRWAWLVFIGVAAPLAGLGWGALTLAQAGLAGSLPGQLVFAAAILSFALAGILGANALVAVLIKLGARLISLALRRDTQTDYRALLGWNFIKVTRIRFPLRIKLRALRDAWFGDRVAARDQGVGLLLGAAAAVALSLLLSGPLPLPIYDPRLAGWLTLTPLVAALPLALHGLAHLAIAHRDPAARGEELSRRRGLTGGRARKSVPMSVFVSVVGISVGVWALIVVISVLSGFQNDLKDKLVAYNPNVEVAARLAGDALPDWRALERRLAALDGVARTAAVSTNEVMVASPANINVNITVHGVDPETYGASGPFHDELQRGAFAHLAHPEGMLSDTLLYDLLSRGDRRQAPGVGAGMGSVFAKARPALTLRPGIVLGSELARSLHVEPGGQVDLISPEGELAPTGLIPKSRSFQVVGVFESGLYELDLKTVYIARDEARRFFGTDVNRIELRLHDLDDTEATLAAAGGIAPEGAKVRDWKQFNKNLFSALALEKLVMFVVLGFIILVASFNIMSSLATVLLGKTRDIAILRSMGMTRRDVFAVFQIIGLVVGLFGAISGALLGWGSCTFIDWWGIKPPVQLYLKELPVDLEPTVVLVIVALTVLLSYAATVIPARRAAAISPTMGLRYE